MKFFISTTNRNYRINVNTRAHQCPGSHLALHDIPRAHQHLSWFSHFFWARIPSDIGKSGVLRFVLSCSQTLRYPIFRLLWVRFCDGRFSDFFWAWTPSDIGNSRVLRFVLSCSHILRYPIFRFHSDRFCDGQFPEFSRSQTWLSQAYKFMYSFTPF
jgi:hypothetical protein